MFKQALFTLSFLIFLGCSGDKKVDRSAYEDELESREIVHVTEAQLFEATLKVGDSIANLAQKKLGGSLQQAIKNEGIEGAIKFCNLNAYNLVDSLETTYDAEIKRVSINYRNPSDKPDSIETQLLEAYEYNVENGIPLTNNIQKIHQTDYLLFTKPIEINNPLCLQCHGKIGKQLSEKTNELIKELYPEDLAVNYEMNDLRGMWSIKLSQKKIIQIEF